MARHRTYSIEFERYVALEFLGGEALLRLSKRHDISRNLIRLWVAKYEADEFDEQIEAADLLREYQVKIVALERLGRPLGARDRVPKGGEEKRSSAEKRAYVRSCRPRGMSVARGCDLMGLPRSTYYDVLGIPVDDPEIVSRVHAVCDECATYGYRRVGAALRHQGIVVNSKKVRRLIREHDLQPRCRTRFVATTERGHDLPVFPNLAQGMDPDGPNQLWVADLTYVAVVGRFVYVALVIDACSRRIVGWAISRSIDTRLALAALEAAIGSRQPPEGCVHNSERGSQRVDGLSQAAS